ncbi:myosin light chain kinase 2, skeletal/cardiac muscle [Tiliqua scincoides]|uniref:myosin light chain kinase 2, skeletal/cardiac muscle n=1 Tax=Tiliqua scincoides TaxID=71010 RepID=UPI00346354E8
MEKDGDTCTAHDTGGGEEAPAAGPTDETKANPEKQDCVVAGGESPAQATLAPQSQDHPAELGHTMAGGESLGDAKAVEQSQSQPKEPDHVVAGGGSPVETGVVKQSQDHPVAGGESPSDTKGVEESPDHPQDTQQKQVPLQQSFSCPATLPSLKEVPEEGSADHGEQKSLEPPAFSPPLPKEPTKLVPDQVQEPAGEQPSPAGLEEERTLPETSPLAPEGTSDFAGAKISTKESCPAEQRPPEDAATPGEVGAPLVKAPTSPYLTEDPGKEDPSLILDDTPPPPAPFTHRIIQLRTGDFKDSFSINTKEMLGGGKFGEVRTCKVKETGLKLAVKIIKKQGPKDREMAEVEIDVMNQLNHRNLIQLYDAIETPREIMLFMEFVEGGELFERIIDEEYNLTEVDCMVFVRQICDGILFMHQMRVLHLDLKPENILCVTATGHMVKIIDFGLARRFNPAEKLKVNFGTPEFLSPEVVSYEQVSYTTDMWSMGVITYMLLSGLSPFMGDNDTETLNNVLASNWYFDEEAFEGISDEAKDFVSNLIIKNKSRRMNAAQCLQHPWLNNLAAKAKSVNRRLKSQVLLRKYVMRRRWKKNFIGVCAANRFKKITSSGSLTALGV